MDITERFINYTQFDTQSAEDSDTVPSTRASYTAPSPQALRPASSRTARQGNGLVYEIVRMFWVCGFILAMAGIIFGVWI